jgi:hypothetical protein
MHHAGLKACPPGCFNLGGGDEALTARRCVGRIQGACEEQEFELAEHLLRALEAIARQQANSDQVDAAYALLTTPCDQPLRVHASRKKAGSN